MNAHRDGDRGVSCLQRLSELFLRRHPWQVHFFNETVTGKEVAAAARFLISGQPLQEGDSCKAFSTAFSRSLGGEGEAFLFGSGRMALYAILEVLHITPGDEVILPAFTCEVVVHALRYRGIRPVYADIDPFTFNTYGAAVERVTTDKTRAIIAQHTFGVPCDMGPILDLARRRGLYSANRLVFGDRRAACPPDCLAVACSCRRTASDCAAVWRAE